MGPARVIGVTITDGSARDPTGSPAAVAPAAPSLPGAALGPTPAALVIKAGRIVKDPR